MEQKNFTDTMLINDMVQRLGLSPLEIFTNWIATGEIKNITLSIVYKNGDEIKADLLKSDLSEDDNQRPSLNFVSGNDIEEVQAKSDGKEDNKFPSITSFSKGIIRIAPSQNMIIGGYVYTTGDILPDYRAIPGVKVRGIILSYSDEKMTLLKYAGSDFTVHKTSAEIKDGWRYPTVEECELIIRHKDRLNISLAAMRRKQIADSLSILCQNKYKDILSFDVTKQVTKNVITCPGTQIDRYFSLYLVKDMKIVRDDNF